MSDTRTPEISETDKWRAHREEMKARRDAQLPPRQAAIKALVHQGFRVRELTPYHFRIDGKLDLFPVHRRYHFIPANKRGSYRDPLYIAQATLREGRQ